MMTGSMVADCAPSGLFAGMMGNAACAMLTAVQENTALHRPFPVPQAPSAISCGTSED